MAGHLDGNRNLRRRVSTFNFFWAEFLLSLDLGPTLWSLDPDPPTRRFGACPRTVAVKTAARPIEDLVRSCTGGVGGRRTSLKGELGSGALNHAVLQSHSLSSRSTHLPNADTLCEHPGQHGCRAAPGSPAVQVPAPALFGDGCASRTIASRAATAAANTTP